LVLLVGLCIQDDKSLCAAVTVVNWYNLIQLHIQDIQPWLPLPVTAKTTD